MVYKPGPNFLHIEKFVPLKCVNRVIYFQNYVTLLPEGVFNFAG